MKLKYDHPAVLTFLEEQEALMRMVHTKKCIQLNEWLEKDAHKRIYWMPSCPVTCSCGGSRNCSAVTAIAWAMMEEVRYYIRDDTRGSLGIPNLIFSYHYDQRVYKGHIGKNLRRLNNMRGKLIDIDKTIHLFRQEQ